MHGKVILDERLGVRGGDDGGVGGWGGGGEEGGKAKDVVIMAVGGEDEVGFGTVGI